MAFFSQTQIRHWEGCRGWDLSKSGLTKSPRIHQHCTVMGSRTGIITCSALHFLHIFSHLYDLNAPGTKSWLFQREGDVLPWANNTGMRTGIPFFLMKLRWYKHQRRVVAAQFSKLYLVCTRSSRTMNTLCITLAFTVCFQYLQIFSICLRDLFILVFRNFLNKGLRDIFN